MTEKERTELETLRRICAEQQTLLTKMGDDVRQMILDFSGDQESGLEIWRALAEKLPVVCPACRGMHDHKGEN